MAAAAWAAVAMAVGGITTQRWGANLPMVLPHDPVGAYLQLQTQERLDAMQQREQEFQDRQATERQRLSIDAAEKAQQQDHFSQHQTNAMNQGGMTPMQQRALSYLEQAHQQGLISDKEYQGQKINIMAGSQVVRYGDEGSAEQRNNAYQQGMAQKKFENDRAGAQDAIRAAQAQFEQAK